MAAEFSSRPLGPSSAHVHPPRQLNPWSACPCCCSSSSRCCVLAHAGCCRVGMGGTLTTRMSARSVSCRGEAPRPSLSAASSSSPQREASLARRLPAARPSTKHLGAGRGKCRVVLGQGQRPRAKGRGAGCRLHKSPKSSCSCSRGEQRGSIVVCVSVLDKLASCRTGGRDAIGSVPSVILPITCTQRRGGHLGTRTCC